MKWNTVCVLFVLSSDFIFAQTIAAPKLVETKNGIEVYKSSGFESAKKEAEEDLTKEIVFDPYAFIDDLNAKITEHSNNGNLAEAELLRKEVIRVRQTYNIQE